MSDAIVPIRSAAAALASPLAGAAAPAASGENGFQSLLEHAIGTVEQSRQEANQAAERFMSGEGEELHTMILAAQKAELTFDLALQVRNKVTEAYQEVMRMQM